MAANTFSMSLMAIPPSPLASQLPLLELGWEGFEKFCCELVGRLPGVEHSHLQGGQGDTQQGIDIVAARTDGATWVFQCKRVKAFRPDRFRRAVAAASFQADRYVLLLASQGTAAIREQARQHPKWEVWDANDIAQRVRMLPAESARSLVVTHFGPQWRNLFLGQSELTPFVSADEFFRSSMDRSHLFHHAWGTVGRGDTLQALREFAKSPDRRVAILPGRGGIGKSKVLHAFARAAADTGPRVHFALPGVPFTPAVLDEMERGPSLIVVDDAHQRDDLATLLAAARRPHAPLQLVLAIRPYARDGIHAALSRAGFDVSELLDLPELRELTPGETEALAREVLGTEYAHLAGVLAAQGGDSPLITVLGAQLIRREQLDPRLLSQRDEFRRIVLNAFHDALLGEVGDRADPRICRDMLRLASALSPFRPDLPDFQNAAGAFLAVRVDEFRDALQALEDAGVLLRRGRRLRVTPDVLADYALEEACLDRNGMSTGYAERVHETFRDSAPGALLRNLAELDWRRSRGGATSGGERLLRGIWGEMEAEFRVAGVARRAEMIHGLGVVAYYQPGPALRLVRMAQPHQAFWAGPGDAQVLARVVPPVLGTIAYNLDYTEECCELLWRLARDQPLNALDPRAPMAVLHELAGYRPYKAIELQHAVVTAVERWVAKPEAHEHLLSPLDVLVPVLAKTALSPGWEPLVVLPGPTAALRERALAIVEGAARGEDVRATRRAVESLGFVLDEPVMPDGQALPDGFEALWYPHRARALAILAELCAASAHPLVHLACLKRLSRHVERRSVDPLAEGIRTAFASVERSFELRFTELLLEVGVSAVYDVPPWTDRPDGPGSRERHDAGRRETAAEFLVRYPDPVDGRARIASRMEAIEALAIDPMRGEASCRVIAADLAELDPDYTADLCERAVLGPPSLLLSHLPPWLYRVRRTRPERYLRLARQVLHVGSGPECAALAATLYDPEGPPIEGTDDLLPQTLAHPDSRVKREALASLWLLARHDPERATELALTLELGRSAEVAERFAETFVVWHPGADALPPSVWDALLEKLVPVEHLDTGSVYQLLRLASRGSPRGVVRMLRARIRRVVGETSLYRPLPSVRPEALGGFLAAPDHEEMLREIRDAFLQPLRTEADWMPWLYSLASAGYGDAGLRVLREWIDSGGTRGVLAACGLLRVAQPEFLLERADFIEILLSRADTAGLDVLETVRTTLYDVVGRVAAEGEEAGVAGNLWPPLVQIQEKGQALSEDRELHRLAREFYRELARLAEERIRDARDSDEERLL
jgi:hypothetical protein